MGSHLASDDLLLAILRFAPLLFVVGGILVVGWLARERSTRDLQPDVLAALSETEALPPGLIRRRPPLDTREVDPEVLVRVLEELRGAGLAVRWYEAVPSAPAERQVVYRRITRTSGTATEG